MRFFSKIFKPRRIHLDYASTTPVHETVVRAMAPYWNTAWANASAIYAEGAAVREVVEKKRAQLAEVLHVRSTDIIFTSGGTESNNLAIIGIVEALHKDGRAYDTMEIISTHIEHPSIANTLAYLEKKGVVIIYAPLDTDGRLVHAEFQKRLTPQTVLVTFAYVNSEIGVVQDVKRITRTVRAFNEKHHTEIRIHLDAAQAPLWLSCELDRLGVDLLSLDAGKCYGPKGVGVLAKRHWVTLTPIVFGGSQEQGMRPGTENTPLIVGCVEALVRAQKEWETRASRVAKPRDYFITRLVIHIPEAIINGSREARVANNVNISLPGFDTEYATIWLDTRGVAVSTKSACGTGKSGGSHVVREISHDDSRALATLRFTLGEDSTKKEIDTVVSLLKEYVTIMSKYKE